MLTGYTTSLNFPVAGGPIQPSYGGGTSDAFVLRLDPTKVGNEALTYSTFLGGAGTDIGYDVLLAPGNRIIAGGSTGSRYFPSLNPTATQNSPGIGDGYVVIVGP